MDFKEALNIVNEEIEVSSFDFFKIFIRQDEGQYVPHFHLESKRGRICIRIDIPAYFKHGTKDFELNTKSKKDFLKWINSKPIGKMYKNEDGILPKNNWKNIRNIWNTIYYKYKIKCNQPDYITL